ncbi:MAG: protein kinase [Gemmatimonadota bacterium]
MTDPTHTARLDAALEGRYRIERMIGEGGMATVYLADDLKHNRKVALKVLKPELAAVVGSERFLAEIETTANLQHPNILPLFDSGEADGLLFFVMPYVEGETLSDRIRRERQLPVDEALGIATAVAHALHAAHERGIVHRDIKPGNILVSSGQPLVADFGIALAVGAGGGGRLTETGLSLGTPYYMSPEQATGDQVVGPASDTFALACVLYEMLAGEPPYPGATAQAVLGKIIQGTPVSATAVRKSVPPNVDAAIRRALEKIPADRFGSALDFAKALADPAFRYGEDSSALLPGSGRRWRTAAVAASVVAVGALAALAFVASRPAPSPVTRTYLRLPEGQDAWLDRSPTFTLSPDGSRLAYMSTGGTGEEPSIWIKERDQLQARPLSGASPGSTPSFSPDGNEIAFIQDDVLKKVPVVGGPSVTLAEDVNTQLPGTTWLEDGSIVYTNRSYNLLRVPSSGAVADTLILQADHEALRGQGGIARPEGLPGDRGVVFGSCNSGCAAVGLYVLDLESGEVRKLLDGAGRAFYAPTGHLVYVRGEDGAVFAAPFDLETLAITGPAIPVLENVGTFVESFADITMSANGDLVYLETEFGVARRLRELVWVSPEGEVPVDSTWKGTLGFPAVSPDGQTIAVGRFENGRSDIWLKTGESPPTRLTFDGTDNQRPFWHPDGEIVGFVSDANGERALWMKRADLTDNAQLLWDFEDDHISEGAWSPDGAWVVARMGSTGDIWAIRPGVDTVATPISVEPGVEERGPAISPDGRWIAYSSDVEGVPQIYVRPFPDAAEGAPRQVTTEGARNARWSADGSEIFYEIEGGDGIGAARVTLDPTFSVGGRRVVIPSTAGSDRYRVSAVHPNYDVDPGAPRLLRILYLEDDDGRNGRPLVYVQNWIEALRAQVGGN